MPCFWNFSKASRKPQDSMVQPGGVGAGVEEEDYGLALEVGEGDFFAVLVLEGEVFYFVAYLHFVSPLREGTPLLYLLMQSLPFGGVKSGLAVYNRCIRCPGPQPFRLLLYLYFSWSGGCFMPRRSGLF